MNINKNITLILYIYILFISFCKSGFVSVNVSSSLDVRFYTPFTGQFTYKATATFTDITDATSASFFLVNGENTLIDTIIFSPTGSLEEEFEFGSNVFISGGGMEPLPYSFRVQTPSFTQDTSIDFQTPYYQNQFVNTSSVEIDSQSVITEYKIGDPSKSCYLTQMIKINKPNLFNFYQFYDSTKYLGPTLVVETNEEQIILLTRYQYNIDIPTLNVIYKDLSAVLSNPNNGQSLICNAPSSITWNAIILQIPGKTKAFIKLSIDRSIEGVSFIYDENYPISITIGNLNNYRYNGANYFYYIPIYKTNNSNILTSKFTDSLNGLFTTGLGVCTVIGYTYTINDIDYLETSDTPSLSFSSIPYFQSSIVRINLNASNEKYDFFVIYDGFDNIVSNRIPVTQFQLDNIYSFDIPTSFSIGTRFFLRGYLKCGGYDPQEITSFITGSSFTYLHPTKVSSNMNISSTESLYRYSISITGTQYYEIPAITIVSSNLPIDGSTMVYPKKTIKSEFPYRFFGSREDYWYRPLINYLPDTPISAIQLQYDEVNFDLYDIYQDTSSKYYDMVSPTAYLMILFDQESINGNIDMIEINIFDTIGIDYNKCNGSFGPFNFNVKPWFKTKGGNQGDSTYKIPFKLNRYFCDSELQFYCEDLRGNTLFWKRSEILPMINNFAFIQQCNTNMDIKLVSIETEFTKINSLSAQFTVLLHGYTDIISANLYLHNGEAITNISLQVNDLNLGSRTLTMGGGPMPSTYTLYRFSLDITDANFITQTFSVDEIKFIADEKGFQSYYTSVSNPLVSFSFEITNLVNSKYYVDILPSGTFNQISSVNFILSTLYSPYTVGYRVSGFYSDIITFDIDPKYSSIPHKLWVDKVCDTNNFCQEFSPFNFVYSNAGNNLNSGSLDFVSSQLDAVPNTIDSAMENRKAKFTFSAAPSGWSLDTSRNPILYIVESISLNKLAFPMNKVSVNESNGKWESNIEIPLNWGSRGVLHASVYGITSSVGFFTGIEFASTFSIISSNLEKPVIWSTELAKTNSNTLMIRGSNLDYIGQHGFYITSGDNTYGDLVLDTIDASNSYVSLPNGFEVDDSVYLYISSLTDPIPVLVIDCMDPTCNKKGSCQRGKCECDPGWDGLDCSINTNYQCKSNCSGNGKCDALVCNCFSGFMGPICEMPIANNSKVTLNISTEATTPTTTFNQFSSSSALSEESKKTSFKVLLTRVDEYDFKGKLVKPFDLLGKWQLQSFNLTTYTYTMPLVQGSLITVIVTLTGSDEQLIEFANNIITIPPNSIKYYIKVENYTFVSSLNHLTFTWEANYKVPNPCVEDSEEIQYGGSNLDDIHYIMIPANQLQLYGRFSNYIIVDNKIFLSSNQAQLHNDKVHIKVNTPFFKNQIELDPDFSVLVNFNKKTQAQEGEYDDECNPIESKSGLPKYAIPVIIAVSSFVGAILIAGLLTLLYKKNMRFRLAVLTTKQSFRSKPNSFSSKLSNFN